MFLKKKEKSVIHDSNYYHNSILNRLKIYYDMGVLDFEYTDKNPCVTTFLANFRGCFIRVFKEYRAFEFAENCSLEISNSEDFEEIFFSSKNDGVSSYIYEELYKIKEAKNRKCVEEEKVSKLKSLYKSLL